MGIISGIPCFVLVIGQRIKRFVKRDARKYHLGSHFG
jgi:hypothetical protein